MTDEPSFLQAIIAEPDIDAPRLVYADWLEETAVPVAVARARFIRLQIELANNDRRADDYPQRGEGRLVHD